jgi:hypothetical protein
VGAETTVTTYPTSVSDANNSYTDTGKHLTFTDGTYNYYMSIWYAKNIAGGTGLKPTAAFSGSIFGFILCHQYANMNTSSPLDITSSGSQTSTGTSVTSSAFTTTFANDVIFAFSMVANGGWGKETFTPGTNLTLRALDYCALQCGPGAPTTPYTDIWQASAAQDWAPNAIQTSQTASISYTTNLSVAADAGIVVAAFKGLGGTPVRLRGSVVQ